MRANPYPNTDHCVFTPSANINTGRKRSIDYAGTRGRPSQYHQYRHVFDSEQAPDSRPTDDSLHAAPILFEHLPVDR